MEDKQKDKFEILYDYLNDKFNKIDKAFYVVTDRLSSIEKTLVHHEARMGNIEALLTNHVTDTDKKIDSMREEINSKLDQILKK